MRIEIKQSLDRYAKDHCPTGGFLRLVLENDLMGAMGKADLYSRINLYDICDYVYNHMPPTCHGSAEKVKVWLAARAEDVCDFRPSQFNDGS